MSVWNPEPSGRNARDLNGPEPRSGDALLLGCPIFLNHRFSLEPLCCYVYITSAYVSDNDSMNAIPKSVKRFPKLFLRESQGASARERGCSLARNGRCPIR